MKHLQENKIPFFKRVTNVFGIGKNLALIIHKKLGLNKRTSSIFLTQKHSRDFATLMNGILTEKKLKTYTNEIQAVERNIRTHRSMHNKGKASNGGYPVKKNV